MTAYWRRPLQGGALHLDLQQPWLSTGYVCRHIIAPGPGLPDLPFSHCLAQYLDPILLRTVLDLDSSIDMVVGATDQGRATLGAASS